MFSKLLSCEETRGFVLREANSLAPGQRKQIGLSQFAERKDNLGLDWGIEVTDLFLNLRYSFDN